MHTFLYYMNLTENRVCGLCIQCSLYVVLCDHQLSSLYLLVLKRSICLYGLETDHLKIKVSFNFKYSTVYVYTAPVITLYIHIRALKFLYALQSYELKRVFLWCRYVLIK